MDTKQIIRLAGGPKRIADARGLNHSTVCGWTRIPPQHAREVAAMARLSVHDVRPDIFGPSPEAAGKGAAA